MILYPSGTIVVNKVGLDDFFEQLLTSSIIPTTTTGSNFIQAGISGNNVQDALSDIANSIINIEESIPSGIVTITGIQTISGQKTFEQQVLASGITNINSTDLNITTSGQQDINFSLNNNLLLQLLYTGELLFKSHSAYSGSDLKVVTAAVQTIDNTDTTLISLPLDDNSAYWIETFVIGRRTGGTPLRIRMEVNRASAYREGGGAATLVGTVDNTVTRSLLAGGYDIILAVSGNNFIIQVNGDAGETVNWTGSIFFQKISTSA